MTNRNTTNWYFDQPDHVAHQHLDVATQIRNRLDTCAAEVKEIGKSLGDQSGFVDDLTGLMTTAVGDSIGAMERDCREDIENRRASKGQAERLAADDRNYRARLGVQTGRVA